ncbi:MAG: DUF4249 domain-containing protein [Bacteroidetes bacterium]|nr:DUF4249 domain-containing protein [Bacteroidota bacterium]
MKLLKYVLSLFFIAMIGCETNEDIVDFPLHKSRLVINCSFSETKFWTVHISKSLSVIDNAPLSAVEDAVVKIFEDGVLLTKPTYFVDGFYISFTDTPIIGKKYSITVSAPGFESVFASDSLPVAVPISSISMVVTDSAFYTGHLGEIVGYLNAEASIVFDDPANQENAYVIAAFRVDTIYSFDSTSWNLMNRPLFLESTDLNVETRYGETIILSDELINGQTYEVTFTFQDSFEGVNKPKAIHYIFILRSLSPQYYLYERTYGLFSTRIPDPFSEPVQVYNNIENGFGIFGGYSESSDTIMIQ